MIISGEIVAHNVGPRDLATGTTTTWETITLGFLVQHTASTRASYANDLRLYTRWCHEHNIDPVSITRAEINVYVRYMEEILKYTRSTIARKLSTLSSTYGYAVEEDHITASPVQRVKRPKVPSDSPRTGPTKDEVKRLLYAAREHSPRAYALLNVLIHNGLRVSEACGINIEHMRYERGHRTLTIYGKGGTIKTAPLTPTTVDAFTRYHGNRNHGPLFLSDGGKRLTRQAAWSIVRTLGRTAVIPDHLTPHALRHSAITGALDAGVPLRDVQAFARHKDPRTTQRYDDARESLDRHPAYTLAAHFAINPEGVDADDNP